MLKGRRRTQCELNMLALNLNDYESKDGKHDAVPVSVPISVSSVLEMAARIDKHR